MAKRKESIVKPTTALPPKSAAKPEPPKQPLPVKPAGPKDNPKLEASVDHNQAAGEFKIDREIDPAKHQSQIVHIDKEGNLTFGE